MYYPFSACPGFAVHNGKLSQEMCFILSVYYTRLRAGRSEKEETVAKFDRKGIVHFFFAILAYVHDAL